MREAWWFIRFLWWRIWQAWIVAPVEDATEVKRQSEAWLHRLSEPLPIPGVRIMTVDELLAECGLTREIEHA